MNLYFAAFLLSGRHISFFRKEIPISRLNIIQVQLMQFRILDPLRNFNRSSLIEFNFT